MGSGRNREVAMTRDEGLTHDLNRLLGTLCKCMSCTCARNRRLLDDLNLHYNRDYDRFEDKKERVQ
jgi:hypothetical protein